MNTFHRKACGNKASEVTKCLLFRCARHYVRAPRAVTALGKRMSLPFVIVWFYRNCVGHDYFVFGKQLFEQDLVRHSQLALWAIGVFRLTNAAGCMERLMSLSTNSIWQSKNCSHAKCWHRGLPLQACENDCNACSDATTCTECANNKYLHAADCVATCPAGYFGVGADATGRTCQASSINLCSHIGILCVATYCVARTNV